MLVLSEYVLVTPLIPPKADYRKVLFKSDQLCYPLPPVASLHFEKTLTFDTSAYDLRQGVLEVAICRLLCAKFRQIYNSNFDSACVGFGASS